MGSEPDRIVDRLVQEGMIALKRGDRRQAWRSLTRALRRDPENETAWLWLSGLYSEPEQIAFCLYRVLAINPQNQTARAALDRLGSGANVPPPLPADVETQALQEKEDEAGGPVLHLLEKPAVPARIVSDYGGLEPVVCTENLTRVFRLGGAEIRAVDNVTVEIAPHQVVAIKGRSGSGKTTLLNLIAGLDRPTAGAVYVDGENVARLTEAQRIRLRRRRIGFVFQSFGLLPMLSAAENVEVPLRILGATRRERELRSAEVLELVGLTGRARHRPYELSGGEQQRVAIARALVNRPAIVLADEPTGKLDSTTGKEIVGLLRDVMEQEGVTVIIATHDPVVMDGADRVHELRDGKLVA